MSAAGIAAAAVAASALAWAAIFAAARLDLARWVWLPALRAGGALSLASTGLLLLGAPVPAAAPALLALAGAAGGVAIARRRAARPAGEVA